MAHIVTVPLVVAYRADGSQVFRYVGQTLPDGLADGEVERLTEGGFVAEAADPEADAQVVVDSIVDDLDKLTKAQLVALAEAEGINLGVAKTKPQHVAAINAGREAKADPVPDAGSEDEQEQAPAGSDSSDL